jgi:NADH dehydrogenase
MLIVIFWWWLVVIMTDHRNNLSAASAFVPTLGTSTYTTKSGRHALHSTSKNDDSTNHGGSTSMKKRPHIVILGGGFGGINTALTLPTLPWWLSDYSSTSPPPKITLIDKSERFVFLPLLYELCVDDASLDEVAPTFTSLLEDGSAATTTGGGGGGGSIESVFSIIPELAGALAGFVIPRTMTNQLFGKKDTDDNDTNNAEASFLQAKVQGIDVNNQQVVITKLSSDDNCGGEIEYIEYDALIIATGSEISLDLIPGASKYALPFYTVEQALELKRRLALLDTHLKYSTNNDSPVNIVVVGGGYGGVELALNLVDRFGGGQNTNNVNVQLIHRGKQVLEYATEHNRRMGIDRLASAGVKVMTTTSVVEILQPETENTNRHDGKEMLPHVQQNQCIVQLSNAEGDGITSLPATLLLWTAGATPTSDANMGIRNSILPRDSMGRILTSSTLNVPEYPNIFAIGDCSRPTKVPYPGTAQVAMQQATVASWNVFATLTTNNRRVGGGDDERGIPKLLPFNFISLGEMMTLGSEDATISTLGGNVELSGPVASWLRRWIYAVRMPTPRQALTAAVDGTGRKLTRGAARRRKSVEWK